MAPYSITVIPDRGDLLELDNINMTEELNIDDSMTYGHLCGRNKKHKSSSGQSTKTTL